MRMAVVHNQIGVAKVSGYPKLEQFAIQAPVESNRRIAQRAERNSHRHIANVVVNYLVPRENLEWICSSIAIEFQDDHRLVAVTEGRRSARRLEIVEGIAKADMLVFSPDEDPKASVLVFTDTDCGYCRQLHQQMPEYHALGIEIRYLAYPRTGVGSPSYDRMVSAWCAADPLDALTRLKNGEEIPPRTCVNPVSAQYQLGQDVGLSGTPTLVLADGRMLPGYTPPAQLAALLEL